VIELGRRLDARELALDILGYDLAKLPEFEREVAVDETLVALHRARSVLLVTGVEILLQCFVPTRGAGAMFAQRQLGQNAFRFRASVGERDDRKTSDRDKATIGSVLNNKAFGAALETRQPKF